MTLQNTHPQRGRAENMTVARLPLQMMGTLSVPLKYNTILESLMQAMTQLRPRTPILPFFGPSQSS